MSWKVLLDNRSVTELRKGVRTAWASQERIITDKYESRRSPKAEIRTPVLIPVSISCSQAIGSPNLAYASVSPQWEEKPSFQTREVFYPEGAKVRSFGASQNSKQKVVPLVLYLWSRKEAKKWLKMKYSQTEFVPSADGRISAAVVKRGSTVFRSSCHSCSFSVGADLLVTREKSKFRTVIPRGSQRFAKCDFLEKQHGGIPTS